MSNYEGYYYEPPKDNKRKKSGGTAASKLLAIVIVVAVAFGSFGFGLGFGGAFFQESALQTQIQEMTQEIAQLADQPSDLFVPITHTEHELQFVSAATIESAAVNAIRKASDSVVSINTTTVRRDLFNRPIIRPGAGSGIISAENDEYIFIITNHHVIENAERVEISIDDYISVAAHPVGSDRESDIAVIRVAKADLHSAGVTNYKIAVFGDASLLEIGQTVIAMGNAMGEGQSATMGIVSAKGRMIPTVNNVFVETIQTDAAINGGNSGGALLNLRGEVIGVNTAKLRGVGIEGIGFAIPSNSVKEIFAEIMERTNVQRPFLGILGMTIDEYSIERHNLPAMGVFVGEVSQDSGAWAAGMRVGDIITSFAGYEILTLERLLELIPVQEIGAVVEVTIVRPAGAGSEEILLEVEIRDANVARSF